MNALAGTHIPNVHTTPLLHVQDTCTGISFLVDTGAEVSVVLPNKDDLDKHPQPNRSLVAANGSPIDTYGVKRMVLKINNAHFSWTFRIAKAHIHIIGADFLRAHALVPDLVNRQLICLKNLKILHGSLRPSYSVRITAINVQDEFTCILKSRPSLTTPTFASNTPKHNVQHYIITTGPPIKSKARRLHPEKLKVTKEEFDTLVRLGIARRSCSPHSSPLHVVPKPDGKYRPCWDYRLLNNATKDDNYPVPRIQDFTAQLAECVIFSKVDLVRGYNQIPVRPKDIPKTAVITPFGLFEFLCMPFGLKNAAQTFQRFMDQVLNGLTFLFVYLDDILVASESVSQHREHLKILFDRLEKYGLVIKVEKCKFGVPKIEFLGHEVNKHGIRPLSSKVEAIQRYSQPTTAKSLQRFLGMVNFYHGFIPRAAELARPLYQALMGVPKSRALLWSDQMVQAFKNTKDALAKQTLLHHPVKDAPIALTSDASDFAMGAVLEQRVRSQWQPLAFFSRQFRKAELKYATYDKELTGIFSAVKHFKYYIEARPFIIFTDHKPIVAALHKKAEPTSARQARQLAAIAEATCDVRHIEGKNNLVADALSRPDDLTTLSRPEQMPDSDDNMSPLINVPLVNCPNECCNQGAAKLKTNSGKQICNAVKQGIDYQELARDQEGDIEVQAYRTATTGLKVEDVPYSNGQFTVLCDTSLGRPRPVIPTKWRKRIFDITHSLAHPGARTTKKLITAKYVWHKMSSQINSWARACNLCQKSKVQTHIRAPLQVFETPNRRFQHVHINLVDPLPEAQGHKYLLTVMDRFTRWPEVIPLKDIDARSVARAYIQNWVARFGVPDVITSDRGSQFISELWSTMSQLLGTQLNQTTAYHPQSNGFIERLHRTLKATLKARITGPDWLDELPWTLLGIRSTPKEDMGASPAEMVYGSTLTVPGDFLPQSVATPVPDHLRQLREKVESLKPTPTSAHGAEHIKFNVPLSLKDAQYVYVRRDGKSTPLQPPYDGPYRVLERGPKHFKMQLGSREDVISVDRLKIAITEGDVQVAQPPKRGRPPNSQVVGPGPQGGAEEVLQDGRGQKPREERVAPRSQRAPTQTDQAANTKPSYAQVTSRRGRIIKPPSRYVNGLFPHFPTPLLSSGGGVAAIKP